MRTTLNCLMMIILASVVGQAIAAELPTTESTAQALKKPTYKGRTYEECSEEFRTELDPETRITSLKALIVFGANGKAIEVVRTLLELFDGYGPEIVQSFGPQADDVQKYLKGPELNPELQPYFQDFHDLVLFHTASTGFYRLAPRATPELVRVLEEKGDRPTARMAAFLALMRQRHPVLGDLMPKIVAQNQDNLTEIVFLMWEDGGDSDLSREQLEKSAPGLLELNEQRHALRAIKAITQSAHPLRPEIAAPMLNKLVQTTADPVVKDAANQALAKLQPAQSSKLPTY